jgi:hypothetical protein
MNALVLQVGDCAGRQVTSLLTKSKLHDTSFDQYLFSSGDEKCGQMDGHSFMHVFPSYLLSNKHNMDV